MPVDKLCKTYRSVESFRDLPGDILNRISHFFEHYKDLEPGKWVKIGDWHGAEDARQLIHEAIERAQQK